MDPTTQKLERRLDARRHRIDVIDNQFVHLLAERGEVAIEIAEIKQELGRPLRDTVRENQHLDDVEHASARMGLRDPGRIRGIVRMIMDYCLWLEEFWLEEQGKPRYDGSQVSVC